MREQLSPGKQILYLLSLIISGLIIVGPLLFTLFYPLFGNPDVESLDLTDPTIAYLYTFFGLFGLFLMAFVVFLRMTKQNAREVINFSKWNFKTLGIVIGVLILGYLVSEGLSVLNHLLLEQIPNGGFLEMEAEHNEQYVAWFNAENKHLFPLAMFVFAVVPAIVEELVFRGLLQKNLIDVSGGNFHFGVIVSGAIFAALHMQAWNLLPMIGLGVIFGYVYHYTKDIRYTMLMHFLHNGFQIAIMFYAPHLVTG
jgi:membrane protease YdiL (CAAX protease family)